MASQRFSWHSLPLIFGASCHWIYPPHCFADLRRPKPMDVEEGADNLHAISVFMFINGENYVSFINGVNFVLGSGLVMEESVVVASFVGI